MNDLDLLLETMINASNIDIKGKSKAMKNGISYENAVMILEHFGFSTDPNKTPDRYIIKNYKYENVRTYSNKLSGSNKNSGGRAEYFVVCNDANSTAEFPSGGRLEMRIECKFQNVSGTTQQKLLYSVYEMQQTSIPNNILLIAGSGFEPEILEICERACQGISIPGQQYPPRPIHMMNMERFVDFCRRAFA